MFRKYQHIERIGTSEVDGLLDGKCFVFPKIDGTSGTVYLDENGVLKAGSRNRELTQEQDNAGFYSAIKDDIRFQNYLAEFPTHYMYGEWLVKHSLNTYRDDAWRKFYIFDVMDGERYLTYDEYKPILEKYDIEYIPPLAIIDYPTEEKLYGLLEKNTFLIKDGCGSGEGLVIKSYGFKNKYGRTTWGKIVTTEFKEKHAKVMGAPELKMSLGVEERICEKFITNALVEKELAKIELENDGWNSKLIPKFLGIMWHTLITEEIWNIIKDFKSPVIDFRRLNSLVIREVKSKVPLLF
jgi:hypothetical protein